MKIWSTFRNRLIGIFYYRTLKVDKREIHRFYHFTKILWENIRIPLSLYLLRESCLWGKISCYKYFHFLFNIFFKLKHILLSSGNSRITAK